MHQKSWDGAVIVVEDRAHLREGHFPNRFAELADGFVDAGTHVEVLTSLGWALADDAPPTWKQWRYGPVTSRLFRVSEKLGCQTNAHLSSLSRALRVWILVHQASRIARACPMQPAAVVVVSYKVSIAMMALLVGRRPFLVHQFSPHSSLPLIVRAAQRVRGFLGLSRPALILAVHDDSWTAGVRKSLPSITIEHLPLAGIRPTASDARREDARRILGIKADQSVALLFGSGHREQDPATVLEALKERPDWQLIVAGSVARHLRQHDIEKWRVRPLVIEGFVEASVRDCAYRATDVVLLSFRPNHGRNSGTLMDAISYGRPVIVSDRSSASDLVRQWGLGGVFSCGSPAKLCEALDELDVDASRLRVLAAQPDMSKAAVANRPLESIARLVRSQ